jgi:hypothetical protein
MFAIRALGPLISRCLPLILIMGSITASTARMSRGGAMASRL